MDPELSRIAANVLRPGEQLLWAGKPLNSGRLQFPTYFKTVFGGFLLLPVSLFFLSTDHNLFSFVTNLIPILVIFGMLAFVFGTMRAKYANPKHNTFLLTRDRAVHVFSHAQATNVASIILDKNTTLRLYSGKSGTGDLLIKRKPDRNKSDDTVGLFFTRRSAWAGLRFNSLPQAEYVRDVANWAIAQNVITSTQATS